MEQVSSNPAAVQPEPRLWR